MPLLRVEGLVAKYGNTVALHGISLEIRPGEIVALVGANGAGKSTTLKVISGLIRPAAGKVFFQDQDITGLSPAGIVKRGVIHCPEGRQVFGRMTVLENLKMGAFCRRREKNPLSELDKVLELFPVLRERQNQTANTLSGGEQQMLAIGRALMARPKLLLLDEPSLGLAPKVVTTIFEVISELNRTGSTILLVEQNARRALGIAHRAYALEVGRVVLEGPGRELLNDPRVKKAYLGEA